MGLDAGEGAKTNRMNAVRSIIGFNIGASSDVGAGKTGRLATGNIFSPEL
jgi:hypothetical protein